MRAYFSIIVFFISVLTLKAQIQEEYCSTFNQTPLNSRPVLSGPELTLETTNFVIHYTLSGEDATNNNYIQIVSGAAEISFQVQVDQLLWKKPPGDNGRGGNDKYDIYVRAENNVGANGKTVREVPVGWNNEWAASYIEITNELSNNVERLKIVVAHEFNHACQFSYTYQDIIDGLWFYENTKN